MKFVEKALETEIIINKSRFITNLVPVSNLDESLESLKEIKKKYYNATHNCYAYILDEQMIQKMSDDGEPARTAGLPILESLLNYELDNVLCVVTRYYGGVKLGKGGLIRAYKNATVEALKKASFYQEETKQIYISTMSYPLYDSFSNSIKEKASIINEDFKEDVTVTFYLNDFDIDSLNDQFNHQLTFIKDKIIKVKVPC